MRPTRLLLVLVVSSLAVSAPVVAEDCVTIDPDRPPFVFVNPSECVPEDVPPFPTRLPPPFP